jgi:metal-sulfur cluster biosynthetic enzyme
MDEKRNAVQTPEVEDVMAALRQCYDPCCREKQISVVDMGLIEEVQIDGDDIAIRLVLTSGWCPFAMHLLDDMQQQVAALPGVASVKVNIDWGPTWSPARLSPEAQAKLRLPLEQLLPLREARLRREAEARQAAEPMP